MIRAYCWTKHTKLRANRVCHRHNTEFERDGTKTSVSMVEQYKRLSHTYGS